MTWALCFSALLVFLLVAQRQALKRKPRPAVEPAAAPGFVIEELNAQEKPHVIEELKAQEKPRAFDGPQVGETWRLNQHRDPWAETIDVHIVDRTEDWVRYSSNKRGRYPSSMEADRFLRIFSRVSP